MGILQVWLQTSLGFWICQILENNKFITFRTCKCYHYLDMGMTHFQNEHIIKTSIKTLVNVCVWYVCVCSVMFVKLVKMKNNSVNYIAYFVLKRRRHSILHNPETCIC